METGVISTEGMSSMITDSIVMIDVECQPSPEEWVVCASTAR